MQKETDSDLPHNGRRFRCPEDRGLKALEHFLKHAVVITPKWEQQKPTEKGVVGHVSWRLIREAITAVGREECWGGRPIA